MVDAAIDARLREQTDAAGGAPDRTRRVLAGRGILAEAARWIAESHPEGADLVVCDDHTLAAAGRRVSAELSKLGRNVELVVLAPGPGDDHVVCDDAQVALFEARLRAAPGANVVAVGAGTISDIVKMGATRLDRPYQCFATAASMNGYTSAIAAVLSKGVKRTLPTRQAEAVFADVEVIAAAPPLLNRAGFGDLLSKPFSHADWLLSHLVRGVPYDERPARLLDDAYDALLSRADAVGRAEPDGLATLTRTILLSGFSMAIAGTSAPASGGEHLVSHYWDMEQHCRDEPLHALHGTQVGIATRMSAMLYERLLALPAEAIDPDGSAARRPDPSWLDGLAAIHPALTPDVVAEVRAQIAAKQRHGAALGEEIAFVRSRWVAIREALGEVLLPSADIDAALLAAGAADRPSAIGVEREHAVRTLRVCRHIRSRYVGLDLVDDLGLLEPWAPEVVHFVEGRA